MKTRKLVTIQKVLNVKKHLNADNLDIINILGWQVVTKSNEFLPGDLCIYFEIDSFLPIRPEYEFLRKSGYKTLPDGREGFVLRTAKFRGVISQGLALPITILSNVQDYSEGQEITEQLGVIKYEEPIPPELIGKVRCYIPGYIQTAETRVQVLQEFLDKYQGQRFYYTEKIDGESATFYIDQDDAFHVASRQTSFEYDEENPMWQFAIENDLENKLRSLPYRACLQGEIYGEGIRKSKYKIKGKTVRFYNLRNLDSYQHIQYVSYQEFVETIFKLKLNTVPILEVGYKLSNDIDTLIELSKGKSFLNDQVEREGIVLRPMQEQSDANFDLVHSRVSFKVINPNFLLKYGE